jgi:hypothetical protein
MCSNPKCGAVLVEEETSVPEDIFFLCPHCHAIACVPGEVEAQSQALKPLDRPPAHAGR